MKKIFFAACLYCIIAGNGWSQDDKFTYTDSFGNIDSQKFRSPELKNEAIFDKLWNQYVHALMQLNLPIVVPAGVDDGASFTRNMTIIRHANVLSSMVRLRAFSSQNKIAGISSHQLTTVAKINDTLLKLNIFYFKGSNQYLVAACQHADLHTLNEMLTALGPEQMGSL